MCYTGCLVCVLFRLPELSQETRQSCWAPAAMRRKLTLAEDIHQSGVRSHCGMPWLQAAGSVRGTLTSQPPFTIQSPSIWEI